MGLAAVLLAGCATSHHSPAVPAGGHHPSTSAPVGATVTKIRVFAPYDRSGASIAGVIAHRSGSCFAASITVSAAGAYRCFAANTILDPCFAAPGAAHTLDCYAGPWSRATRLKVRTLPKVTTALHVTRPWALQLVGGVRCVVTNGTAPIVRHVPLGYQCTDGMAGLLDAGSHASVARVLYRKTDGVIRTLPVATSWRAG